MPRADLVAPSQSVLSSEVPPPVGHRRTAKLASGPLRRSFTEQELFRWVQPTARMSGIPGDGDRAGWPLSDRRGPRMETSRQERSSALSRAQVVPKSGGRGGPVRNPRVHGLPWLPREHGRRPLSSSRDIDVTVLPVGTDLRVDNPPSQTCGSCGTEFHHWAPSAVFGKESVRWPTAHLCRDSHCGMA